MKLRHAAVSPFVRKVMVLAHEQGLLGRIELVATAVSPFSPTRTSPPKTR
jgi:glutathione S-transferase